MLLMMSENIARNMYSGQGIINYPTQLRLVGHFRILHQDTRKYEYQVPYIKFHGNASSGSRFDI
jgi:hypothetical protein